MRAIPWVAVAVAVLASTSGTRSFAQDEADAAALHVLLVADTAAPDIGESVEKDVSSVRQALAWGVPEKRHRVTVLQGEGVTPDGVLAKVEALEVRPQDAVLVYYSGHGAWADDGGHYLRTTGGSKVLPRQRVLAAIAAKQPRLAVVLTDCCSTYVGQTMLYVMPAPDPDVFRDLFFRHRGVVDVTAAKKGQEAIGDTILGGLFTNALTKTLTGAKREVLDGNRDGIVSWEELMKPVAAATDADFKQKYPRGLSVKHQTVATQSPQVFAAGTAPTAPIPKTKVRLGVKVAAGASGAVVAEVVPGSPAEWIGLGAGDRLVSVRVPPPSDQEMERDLPVRSQDEIGRALSAVPGSRLVTLLVVPAGKSDVEERWVRLGP